MGLFFWWGRKQESIPDAKSKPSAQSTNSDANAGLNGAVEVRRPADATVFEFGSSSGVTIAGYCPVSEELEPCRWAILPTSGSNAPQFRVVF